MTLLNARQLAKSFGPRTLFSQLNLSVAEDEKIAIVGPNGCGKSTLLKILARLMPPDEGDIAVRREATVRYVSQQPDFPAGATAREIVATEMLAVKEALEAFEALNVEIAQADADKLDVLLARQAELQATLDSLDGWAWQHRVESVLADLGIRPEDLDRPVDELSGGQRRRVALAQALLASPDLLMLDEPTNHLDADTLDWLERTLADYPGALILITHDRYFLDNVASRIVEFDQKQLYSHPGHYATFVERKLERLRVARKAEARRQKLLEHELEWLSRSPKARTTKARARIDRAEVLASADPAEQKIDLNINFNARRRLGGIILEVTGLAKSYGERQIFQDLHLAVQRQEKIGIIGPNGCGKSTMLKILMGEERADAGQVNWGQNTRPGYLSQTRDTLNPDDTVLEAVHPNEHVHLAKRSIHKRTYLREFLFEDAEQQKKVSSLSGGERCRLLLARLMVQQSNLLILDEPTNDLDLMSLQILEDSLRDFQGCVLLVTHDRYFLNKVCNVIAAFEEDHIERYDGDYDFYKARRDARRQEEKRQQQAERKRAEAERQQARQEAREQTRQAGPGKLSWKEARELEGLEDKILEAETHKEEVEAALADPALYKDRPEQVEPLTRQLNEATAEIEALYNRWSELSERQELYG